MHADIPTSLDLATIDELGPFVWDDVVLQDSVRGRERVLYCAPARSLPPAERVRIIETICVALRDEGCGSVRWTHYYSPGSPARYVVAGLV